MFPEKLRVDVCMHQNHDTVLPRSHQATAYVLHVTPLTPQTLPTHRKLANHGKY